MNRILKHDREGPAPDPKWKLSPDEEKTVVGMILAYDQASIPLSGRQIMDAISHLSKVSVSKTWITEFRLRYKLRLFFRTGKDIQTRSFISILSFSSEEMGAETRIMPQIPSLSCIFVVQY